FYVGITDYRESRQHHSWVLTPSGVVTGWARTGPFQSLPLQASALTGSAALLGKVLAVCTQKSPNQMHRRLINAIDWLAQSSTDPKPSSAMIKPCPGLEV